MDTKKIGAFIALNRKEKGLTQEQLGEKLGVSNKTVSRWENGNYMPDLSMLEPLGKELDITLNELLAGERIEKEEEQEYAERNLVSTIQYTMTKIQGEKRIFSIVMIVIGAFLVWNAFTANDFESVWPACNSIIGVILLVNGIFREVRFKSFLRRMMIFLVTFILIVSGLFVLDYLQVKQEKHPPIYKYAVEQSEGEENIILYKNPFYHLYRINAYSSNEYYILDKEKKYTMETVPISPFNRDISGINHLIQYQNAYVGNNSNTGNLIGNLPLSEYGYVFEIDSENRGLTIHYNATDWYENENLYVEKSLIYNSVTLFGLIQNVETIRYHFSGSSYEVPRAEFVRRYPDYDKVFGKEKIEKEAFNRYVEKKMNDKEFVLTMGFSERFREAE